jgi:hypothetical protein
MRLYVSSLLLALVTPLLIPISASAQTINGCVKNKNGALRIVADPAGCSSRETPISWNQTGPQGEPGIDGVDGAPGANGNDAEVLRVFDATGAEVGIYAGSDANKKLEADPWRYLIYLPNSEILLNVFGIDGEQKSQNVWFYFESTDCTGVIYTKQAGRLIRGGYHGDLYVATGTEVVAIQPLSESSLTPTPTANSCLAVTTPVTRSVVPATVIDPATDLGISFPLPAPLYVGPPVE